MSAEVLRLAKEEVAAGRAKSLSAFVADAVDEKLRRDHLTAILDAMEMDTSLPPTATRAVAGRRLTPSGRAV